jgi:hypothetical protein
MTITTSQALARGRYYRSRSWIPDFESLQNLQGIGSTIAPSGSTVHDNGMTTKAHDVNTPKACSGSSPQ